MKKKYMAPAFELELYKLDKSIASNCQTVVNSGPEAPGHEVCSDFEDMFTLGFFGDASLQNIYNIQFYDDAPGTGTACDCYTTGGNNQYWQS